MTVFGVVTGAPYTTAYGAPVYGAPVYWGTLGRCPPAHLTNVAKGRWVLANGTLSGAPARDVRLKQYSSTKPGRLALEKTMRREVDRGQCTPVTIATGGAPEGDRPPKLRKNLPASVGVPRDVGC